MTLPNDDFGAQPLKVRGSRVELEPYQSLVHVSVINRQRAERWHGDGLHSWSLADWAVALAGECGELCNVVKKLNRVRDGLRGNRESPEELRQMLADEIADVFLYLDLLAQSQRLLLEEVVRAKFNATSDRLGFEERL